MSGFLETHTEDGQSRLDGFLRPGASAPPPKPAPRPRSWIQTFLGREAREEIDRHMQELHTATDAATSEEAQLDEGDAQAVLPELAAQQHRDQVSVERLPFARANDVICSAAHDAAALQDVAGGHAHSQHLPDACREAEGVAVSQGRAAEGGGLSQSQGVELSLRDWAPATAAAMLASQQEQLPGSQQPGPGPSRFAAGSSEERAVGVQEGCRDVLDEDEAGPCLQHPWEEPPGALGEAEAGPGAGGAADAPTGERPAAPRSWQCQVWVPSALPQSIVHGHYTIRHLG